MASVYQQLCPVLFGANAIDELGKKALEFGAKKALCIYDAGVKAAGIAERAVKALEDVGIEVKVFDGVVPDAPDTVINALGREIQGTGVDVIVGLGGGSSMDTAKSVAVLAENPLPISSHFTTFGGGMFHGEKVKLILAPTASGTGSEVTPISVVHDMERNVKDTILRPADLAILDPTLTITAPASVTAASGLDALSHALEAYTSKGANIHTDLLALEAIRLIAENLRTACENGNDLDARSALSYASNIAGIAFADASVHVGHCAAHELGIQLNLPHGVVCALSAPEVLEYCADTAGEKNYKIADALGAKVPENAAPCDAGKIAADAVRKLARDVKIKSFSEMGISREAVVACAEGAVNNNWFIIMAPKTTGVPEMTKLLEQMYDNY